MKKLLLILFLLPILAFGQQYQDTIYVGDISASDTTYFHHWRTDYCWNLQFYYGNLDANDATLSLGNSMDRYIFDPLTKDFPYVLNTAIDTSITFEGSYFSADFLGINIVKGSVTSGYIIIKGYRR